MPVGGFLFVSRCAPYSDFWGWLTTLEQGGHRFELTQKPTAQFQIRVFFKPGKFTRTRRISPLSIVSQPLQSGSRSNGG
ncbi:hypothetical protein C6Y08_11675 [Lactiplantibacillus pentosus]|uniref:Uncharacterized protein n=1 Tax=Lactiplantibacillus pentosus TaxID=1589 RepID=A0ABD7INH0_LACPE|nr:hypothetical protein C6Y08_11675 [Lactiplantibacillus pentosus]RMW46396.1 hypothetical protein D6U18_10595 [Lactiplantibacillus pentosus]